MGDRLPSEQVLATQFGTSRPSVREALSALEILGIIESRGGRGNFIKNSGPISSIYEQEILALEEEESPFELLEARKVIEVEIAQLAAQKATHKEISEMEILLGQMKKTIHYIAAMMEHDREFHLMIAKATHNNFLYSVMVNMNYLLKEKLWVNMKKKLYQNPDSYLKYVSEHESIYKAIKNKDSKNAREKMLLHLTCIEKNMMA